MACKTIPYNNWIVFHPLKPNNQGFLHHSTSSTMWWFSVSNSTKIKIHQLLASRGPEMTCSRYFKQSLVPKHLGPIQLHPFKNQLYGPRWVVKTHSLDSLDQKIVNWKMTGCRCIAWNFIYTLKWIGEHWNWTPLRGDKYIGILIFHGLLW